jgi:hypothetical protein
MFFQGCVLHILHLFVKDIVTATIAKQGYAVADYPSGYLFEDLLLFNNKCKDTGKFFHIHHTLKAQLKQTLAADKLTMLAPMVPTCWGSIQSMAETLVTAKSIPHQLVTACNFITLMML